MPLEGMSCFAISEETIKFSISPIIKLGESKQKGGEMSWTDQLKGNSLDWLLDSSAPAVECLTRRDLLNAPEESLRELRLLAHHSTPIAFIMEKMDPQGFWKVPGPGYSPKYHSTVWSIISLAQAGANLAAEPRLQTAFDYMLEHSLTKTGQFSASGAPSYTIDCLQGNLCWSLTELGCHDERLDLAFDWMAHSVTGEGIASRKEKNAPVRYYSLKCGPNFACGANGNQPCAWGAIKVLRALGCLPVEKRSPLVNQAIQMGIDFLLSVDPAQANYPTAEGHGISQNWWRLGFPVYYISDVLQLLEALIFVGVHSDPRIENVKRLLLEKQDEQGRWCLEYSYSGKAWGNFGTIHRPNKWVTLRMLRVLKALSD
jgi:hypothetical protein